MNYRKPNTYDDAAGVVIIAATSQEEAVRLGRPSNMAAGNVWACKLTVGLVENVGCLKVVG
jgi:hypothetical protein